MAVRPAASRKSAPPGKKPRTRHLESLEKRQLFSVISVTSYGATPNDGSDDTAAIQKALNASKSGDTILFTAGTFDLKTNPKVWPSDRTYRGEDDATLRGKTSSGQLLSFRGDDITITGLTFEGGGIFFDRASGFNQNIVVDNNIFELNTTGEHSGGITFTSGLKHAELTNNYFTGYSGGFGIYGYNYNDLWISNNEFVNITAGMHIDAFTGSANLMVEQNYITGAKGMGMEFQSKASNLVFQDNWFENPNLSTEKKRNNNSMAFSLILDKSSDITIRRNVVKAPQRPDGIGCRIAFEVGGDNTVVEDNYVDGVNHVLAVNDGVGTCSVVAKNNVFKNVLQGANISFPSSNPKRSFEQSNNGPGTKLTWNISRGMPGRNHRYYSEESTSKPDPTPDPTPEPTPDPTPEPTPPVVELPPDPDPIITPDPVPDPVVIPVEDIPADPTDTTPKDPTTDQPPVVESPTTPADPVVTPPVVPPTVPTTTTPPPPPPVVQGPPIISPKPIPRVAVPVMPSKLVAKVISSTRIDLSWTDNSTTETGFVVERSLDGVNWGQVASLRANVTSYSSTGLTYGTKFHFRVRAYNSGGGSLFTSPVSATTTPKSTVVVGTVSTPSKLKQSGPLNPVGGSTPVSV